MKAANEPALIWHLWQAEIDNLLSDVEIPENLRRSVLLTPSGEALTQRIPVEASRSVPFMTRSVLLTGHDALNCGTGNEFRRNTVC